MKEIFVSLKLFFAKFKRKIIALIQNLGLKMTAIYYVEFHFATLDCSSEYIFPLFIEASNKSEIYSTIDLLQKSIRNNGYFVISNSDPKINLERFNDKRYGNLYRNQTSRGKIEYLDIEEYRVKGIFPITPELNLNLERTDLTLVNEEFNLVEVYQKVQELRQLPVRVFTSEQNLTDFPLHLVIKIIRG